ncbi:MAG: hypothetical protein PQJ59_08775 [Spirochaetales bacterium]|nr:hypothetical protein [Spirochaetales bacterium]
MSPFEIALLICFGAAWPASIYKSWKSRSNKGKSLFFLCLILTGYVMGILHKVFYYYDGVIYLYIFNFLMVFTDLLLYFRNERRDRQH